MRTPAKVIRRPDSGKGRKEKEGPFSLSGFTLLELIIVLLLSLLILGMATVAFPRLFSSAKLQAASREMTASLRQTRTWALLRGEKQKWSIQLDTREYGPEGGRRRTLPHSISLIVVNDKGEEVRHGIFPLVFEPPWGWQTAQFHLSDGKKSITIQLDPLTGAVISRGEGR